MSGRYAKSDAQYRADRNGLLILPATPWEGSDKTLEAFEIEGPFLPTKVFFNMTHADRLVACWITLQNPDGETITCYWNDDGNKYRAWDERFIMIREPSSGQIEVRIKINVIEEGWKPIAAEYTRESPRRV